MSRQLRQSSASAPDSDSRRVERVGAPTAAFISVNRSFIVCSRTGASRHRVADALPCLRLLGVSQGVCEHTAQRCEQGCDCKLLSFQLALASLSNHTQSFNSRHRWFAGPLVRRRVTQASSVPWSRTCLSSQPLCVFSFFERVPQTPNSMI